MVYSSFDPIFFTEFSHTYVCWCVRAISLGFVNWVAQGGSYMTFFLRRWWLPFSMSRLSVFSNMLGDLFLWIPRWSIITWPCTWEPLAENWTPQSQTRFTVIRLLQYSLFNTKSSLFRMQRFLVWFSFFVLSTFKGKGTCAQ